jgi:hypothetical protein
MITDRSDLEFSIYTRMKGMEVYYLISIKGLPTQFLSIRAPNFVLVRSRIDIKDPFAVWSVSFW